VLFIALIVPDESAGPRLQERAGVSDASSSALNAMPAPLFRHLQAPVLRQFLKYGVVGAANTLISVLIILLGDVLGLWHIAAYAVAYAVGAVNGYLLNRSWTFNAGSSRRIAVRYFLVQGVALAGSTALVYLLVDVVGLNNVLGQLIAIAVAVAAGFLANRLWTFAGVIGEPPDLGAPLPGPQHVGGR